MLLCHPFEGSSAFYKYAKGIDVTSSIAVLELGSGIRNNFQLFYFCVYVSVSSRCWWFKSTMYWYDNGICSGIQCCVGVIMYIKQSNLFIKYCQFISFQWHFLLEINSVQIEKLKLSLSNYNKKKKRNISYSFYMTKPIWYNS